MLNYSKNESKSLFDLNLTHQRQSAHCLNVGGFSVGPFAVPYVQSFFSTTGLMTTFMFDVSNVISSLSVAFSIIGMSIALMLFGAM